MDGVDDLLSLYNRELLAIRRAAARFAAEHPGIAGRLRISEEAVEDPHVGRLIEAFAFLTARVRRKLDDDFPELTDGLFSILYPHYGLPIPSMAIVQFEAKPDLAASRVIAAGTLVDSEPVEGEVCRFATAYPVRLEPVEIRQATLTGRPFAAPEHPGTAAAAACLRITLGLTDPESRFGTAAPERLRVFLRGQPAVVYPLYELLLNDVVAVAAADGPSDPAPVPLPPSAVAPVGFAPDEGVLPYPETAHMGYRLLTEYFAFPEKFLFVDVDLPPRAALAGRGRSLDLFLYLRRAAPGLERAVTADVLALGCTPVVNLFPHRCEPIAVDHTVTEYRVVPDSRRPRGLEVHSLTAVTASDASGERRPVRPFYGMAHAADPAEARRDRPAWWHAVRRPAEEQDGGSLPDRGPRGDRGTETYLTFVDPDFRPSRPAEEVLSVDALLFNRDLPDRLPFGGGQPRLALAEPLPIVAAIRCLTAPTRTLRPRYAQGGRWRLVSHLALNHLPLARDGGDALREMLLLYDVRNSAETRALIEGLVSVRSEPGSARVRGYGQVAFCRGVDVTIEFDETRFSGSGVFLMAQVLERVLGLFVSVNSFSRLTATVSGRTGVLRRWPARAGDRVLL